jgi:hypothetical protein
MRLNLIITANQSSGTSTVRTCVSVYDFDQPDPHGRAAKLLYELSAATISPVVPEDDSIHPIAVIEAIQGIATALKRAHADFTAQRLARADAEKGITRM